MQSGRDAITMNINDALPLTAVQLNMINGYDTSEMVVLQLYGVTHDTDNLFGIFRDMDTAKEIGRLMVAIHPDMYMTFAAISNQSPTGC